MTVVTADGEVLHATDESHADWMWMARGSGPAFPGVVTSFTLRLAKLPTIIRSLQWVYSLERYKDLVEYLQSKRDTLSRKMELTIISCSTPPPMLDVVNKVPKVLLMNFNVMADSEEEYEAILDPLKLVPVSPLLQQEAMNHETFSSLCDLLGTVYPPGLHWMVCQYQSNDADLDGIRDAFENKAPPGLSHMLTIISSKRKATNGAYAPFPVPGTAFGIYGVYKEDSTSAGEYMKAIHKVLDPVSTYGVLEHPLDKTTKTKSFSADSLKKLEMLRDAADPTNVFFNPLKAPHVPQW